MDAQQLMRKSNVVGQGNCVGQMIKTKRLQEKKNIGDGGM